MLRIIESSSAAQAKSYYTAVDYYIDGREQELTGQWRGEGAKRLGLSGDVKGEAWAALCDNLDPATCHRLTPRQKDNRRVGYDFNFHVPKSVSLLYGLTEDERLLDAFREAVHDTMRDIEAEAKTRVRTARQNADRTTGNVGWGEFIHFTSRPVDEVPDPHLHAHCYVFNTTWDEQEQRWKAVQFGDLKRDAVYFEAKFHVRLARNLAELGLDIERTSTGWEPAGLDQSTLGKFSRRTSQIEELAKRMGITNPERKADLGAKTRSQKAKHLTMEQLQEDWASRLTDEERDRLDRLASAVGHERVTEVQGAAKDAIDRAVEHVFERIATVPERTLLAEALKRSVGKASVQAVEQEFARRDFLSAERKGRRIVTTREVLAEERAMLDFARKGRGACRPLGRGRNHAKRTWLNADQRKAVEHVLGSRDRVVIVRGIAGVGKTETFKEVADWIEQFGHKVFAFAPSAQASRGRLREKGFLTADTVAMLNENKELQQRVRGNVIWVDEAGLLGNREMGQLFHLADALDARVILSGDRYQHSSVSRGSALRLLETEAGLVPAQIKDIMRQTADYRQVVEALSEGRVEDAYEGLDKLGWIREIPTDERYQVLAADYLDVIKAGHTALVISPTHAEGRAVTAAIRAGFKAEGTIHGAERLLPQLVNANLTEAERREASRYHAGDVLVFHQNATGFTKGQRVTLGMKPPPMDAAARFQVYRQSRLAVAEGETLRVTRNGRTLNGRRIENGDLVKVERFDERGNLVTNKGVIAKDYGFLTHGYCVTSVASQGTDVDHVLIAQAWASRGASSAEQAYVSFSRGKKRATIYTDNKQEFLEAISRSDDRLNATDLIGGRVLERGLAREFPRTPDRVQEREAPVYG